MDTLKFAHYEVHFEAQVQVQVENQHNELNSGLRPAVTCSALSPKQCPAAF